MKRRVAREAIPPAEVGRRIAASIEAYELCKCVEYFPKHRGLSRDGATQGQQQRTIVSVQTIAQRHGRRLKMIGGRRQYFVQVVNIHETSSRYGGPVSDTAPVRPTVGEPTDTDPVTSSRAGVGREFADAVREALERIARETGRKDVNR
jgi:hypothetical protein